MPKPDAKACIGAAWDAAASGTSFNFQLTAAGETLTGGANRAALDLVISTAAGTVTGVVLDDKKNPASGAIAVLVALVLLALA